MSVILEIRVDTDRVSWHEHFGDSWDDSAFLASVVARIADAIGVDRLPVKGIEVRLSDKDQSRSGGTEVSR